MLKKIGGILALIAGILLCFYFMWSLIAGGFPADPVGIFNWIINLVLIVLVLLGGILGIADRRSGGALLLMVAVLMIAFYILFTIDSTTFAIVQPYTILDLFIPFAIPYITFEAILILIDGILIIAGGSD